MSTDTQIWRPKPRRSSKLVARIDASPLLAVFVVLVFLLMSPAILYLDFQNFRGVDLPVTQHATPQPGALREDALEVVVSRSGSLFIVGNNNTRGGKVRAEELPDMLRSMLLPQVERRVYVRADARSRYSDVETALDAIRGAGISDITLMVEQGHYLQH